ncbi:MAG: PDGLE domain-containing protein [Candidatus Omnitrophica bacterium]|nr:PDGLE domain-containing protein [Candidatus Omnitrophota bacterium]
MKLITKLWIGIAALVILSPLGLILPGYFKAGSAWGEWGADEIQKLTGYVPGGLAKFASLWNAPLPDYAFRGWEEKGLGHLSLAYIVSAAAGILIVVIIMLLLARILVKK